MLICERCGKPAEFLMTLKDEKVCIGCADSTPPIPKAVNQAPLPYVEGDIRKNQ